MGNDEDAGIATSLAQFSPTTDWYDYGFFLHVDVFSGMAAFGTSCLTAIGDFMAAIEAIDVTEGRTVIRCAYKWHYMVGSLPGRAASGKFFEANSISMLGINKGDGRIQRVDE